MRANLDAMYITASVTTFGLIAATVYYAFHLAERAEAQTDALLRNILPETIVDRLKAAPDATIADSFEEASVLFADLQGFVTLAKKLGPARTVEFLNTLMTEFDSLAVRHGVEKIKTIGDAYMAAAGVPNAVPDHAQRLARLSLDLLAAAERASDAIGDAASVAHRLGLGAAHGRRHRCQAPDVRRMGRHREPRLAPGRKRRARTRTCFGARKGSAGARIRAREPRRA